MSGSPFGNEWCLDHSITISFRRKMLVVTGQATSAEVRAANTCLRAVNESCSPSDVASMMLRITE
jgi:hypothetical protein